MLHYLKLPKRQITKLVPILFFLKVVLNILESAQSFPGLPCDPIIFENTCGRQTSKVSQSPGVHALHNPWHGECDEFYCMLTLYYMDI